MKLRNSLLPVMLACALAGTIAIVCVVPNAQAMEAAQYEEHLILLPYRNAALNNVDPGGIILNEMRYALNLLSHSDIKVSVVTLDSSPRDETFFNIPAQQLDNQIDTLFTPSSHLMSSDEMNSAIAASLDIVLQLAKQPNTHATIVMLQAQAIASDQSNNPQWTKLTELVTDETIHADIVLLGVSGEQMPDLSNYAEGLGLSMPDSSQTGLISLSEHIRAALIPADDLQSSYTYLETVFQPLLTQIALPLQPEETQSKIILPIEGVSNLMLSLSDIPADAELHVSDADGNPIEYSLVADDLHGRQIVNVHAAGGSIFVQTISAAQFGITNPEEEATNEAGSPPSGDAAATGPADQGMENTADQPSANSVSGLVLFTFDYEDQLAINVEQDESNLYKKQEINVNVKLMKGLLNSVLQTYPVVTMELTDGGSYTWPLQQNADDSGLLTANISFQHSGNYTLKAKINIGDFYTLESEPFTFIVRNHQPAGSKKTIYFLYDDPYSENETLSASITSLFTDADNDTLTYMLLPPGQDTMPVLSYILDGFAELSLSDDILQVKPQENASKIVLVRVLATDEDGANTVAPVHATVRSMYQELSTVTLQAPQLPADTFDKRATVHITTQPIYPGQEAYSQTVLQSFYDHALVYCGLIDKNGNAVADPIPMDYVAVEGMYQADLNMPDISLQLSVALSYKLQFDPSTGYQDVDGPVTYSSISTNNIAPQWVAGTEDLGHYEKANNGTGMETYQLQLDFPALFADEDDQQDQAAFLAYTIAVEDDQGKSWPLQPAGDNVYAVGDVKSTENGEEPESDAALKIDGTDHVIIEFQTAGHFTLLLTAIDPDGATAAGSLTIQVSSFRMRILLLASIIAASALVLAFIALLVIHLLKPVYGHISLELTFTIQSFQIKRIVPFKAWGKHNVPLEWLLFYCGVPPEQAMYELAGTTVLVPRRTGIGFKVSAKDFCWTRNNEPLDRKFTLHADDGPVMLQQDEVSIQIMMGTTVHDGVYED